MPLPTVSIVVPSFNQARFLDEALGSLVAQRDQIHEIIVMDGGSSDESRSIIQSYQSELTHWQSQKDEGQADAIIAGFKRATGKVLTWINSDDALLPGAVKAMRHAFASSPVTGLIEGNTVIIDEDSIITRCDRRAGPSNRWARYGYMRLHQPSTFFRRELYDRVGGLDRSLHCTMDTDLWYRMLAATNAQRLPRYIGVHRTHTEAKGENAGWAKRYAEERVILDDRYPNYREIPVRHFLGRIAFHATQLRNGRAIGARADTLACRNVPLQDAIERGLLKL